MANATMMFDVLGENENAAIARNSIDKLLVVGAMRPTASPASPRYGTQALPVRGILVFGIVV